MNLYIIVDSFVGPAITVPSSFSAIISRIAPVESIVIVLDAASVFAFPALSVSTLSPTLTICSPSATWFTSKVYSEEDIDSNVPFVPFVTCISSSVNPVTLSLNVNVYIIFILAILMVLDIVWKILKK